MNVILAGTDAALLEGLAQSLASHGFAPRVVATLFDACEEAADAPPILALLSRALAVESPGDALAITLAPGGALALYREAGAEGDASSSDESPTPPILRRVVLAELTLPLERHRLMSLTRHVHERALVTGRELDGRQATRLANPRTGEPPG